MSDYQGEKFKEYLTKLKKSGHIMPSGNKFKMSDAYEMLDISKQALYQYFDSKNLSRETVNKILKTFDVSEHEVFGIQEHSNARYIGDIESLEDSEGNTKFTEISPGRYRMKVDLVPNHARAGWLAGFEDPTFIEELPKHEITVTEFHKGKYLSFEVDGDSMFDGTIESVPDGCIITGREIARHHWKYKLHAHKYPNWVFVHRTEGILVKRIKSQNLETGEIILLSLNPDKDIYPDRSIFLDDVYKIFNVVKRELN